MQYRISLDIECEQTNDNSQVTDSLINEPRIIQVGWVVFNPLTAEIVDSELHHIKLGVRLSTFIKQLTRITDEELEKGLTIQEVYAKLKESRAKWDASRRVVTWGQSDMDQIRKELNNPEDWEFGHSGHNAKHLYQTYAEANDMNISGGLKKCMGRLGVQFQGKAHNALVDAENTARIYSWLVNKFRLTK